MPNTSAPQADVSPPTRCATHPHADFSTTCTRCGDFACVDCLAGTGICPDCSARTDQTLSRGRTRVRLGIAGLIVPNVLIIAWYLNVFGLEGFPTRLVRLALECGLAYFIYRGATWARRLTVGLLAIASIVCVVSLTLPTAALATVFVLTIWLFTSPDSIEFLTRQHETVR